MHTIEQIDADNKEASVQTSRKATRLFLGVVFGYVRALVDDKAVLVAAVESARAVQAASRQSEEARLGMAGQGGGAMLMFDQQENRAMFRPSVVYSEYSGTGTRSSQWPLGILPWPSQGFPQGPIPIDTPSTYGPVFDTNFPSLRSTMPAQMISSHINPPARSQTLPDIATQAQQLLGAQVRQPEETERTLLQKHLDDVFSKDNRLIELIVC